MKNIIYLLTFFLSITAFSQQRAIEITNIETGKTKVFEQDKRIKIRTLDNKKYVGKLTFADNETIVIEGQSIKIDSLMNIKNQPKLLGTVKTVVLIAGLAVVTTSIIVATGGGNAAFLLFTVGTGVTIGAGVLEAVNTNHTNRKWTFKIIER